MLRRCFAVSHAEQSTLCSELNVASFNYVGWRLHVYASIPFLPESPSVKLCETTVHVLPFRIYVWFLFFVLFSLFPSVAFFLCLCYIVLIWKHGSVNECRLNFANHVAMCGAELSGCHTGNEWRVFVFFCIGNLVSWLFWTLKTTNPTDISHKTLLVFSVHAEALGVTFLYCMTPHPITSLPDLCLKCDVISKVLHWVGATEVTKVT